MIRFFVLLELTEPADTENRSFFSAMQKYETKQTVNKMLNLRRIRLHINFKRFQQK